jgi:hypothetical protein
MSRPFKFYLSIADELGSQICSDLADTLENECFDDITYTRDGKDFEATGFYNLGGGQTVEEEVAKLQNIVWSIAGRFVDVGISATYMPGEYFPGREAQFAEWQKRGGAFVKRCRMCGEMMSEEEDCMKETDVEDVCWRCEDDLPKESNRCACGEVIDSDDPDEKHCDNCKAGAAERLEDR